jgi:hypothetical protein
MSAVSMGSAIHEDKEKAMLKKITLALMLAITAITMSVPASAQPGDYPYASGYQDHAYGRDGAAW